MLPARTRTYAKKHSVRSKAKPVARKARPVRAKHKARPVLDRATKPKATQTSRARKLAPHSRVSNEVSLGLPLPAQARSGGAGFGSLLIVLALVGAIACFTAALMPATYMRWRPAVLFVSQRQTDLTVVGLVLLTITAFIVVLSKGG